MSQLPREAREGLLRAWLAILKERNPEVTWIAQDRKSADEPGTDAAEPLAKVAA